MIESDTTYTEEDVTDQMVKGSSPLESAKPPASSYFPGLRSDLEAIERRLFVEMYRFLEASEEMTRDIFKSFGISDGIPTEEERALPPKENVPKNDDVDVHVSEV